MGQTSIPLSVVGDLRDRVVTVVAVTDTAGGGVDVTGTSTDSCRVSLTFTGGFSGRLSRREEGGETEVGEDSSEEVDVKEKVEEEASRDEKEEVSDRVSSDEGIGDAEAGTGESG